MKHNLQIFLRKKPPDDGILQCRTVTFTERLLRRLFGEKCRVTVIVPGNSVECLSIKEVAEEGDEDE